MHDRVSVNALCFSGPSLSEMERIWRKLAPKRVSFMTSQIFQDGEEAALGILSRGGYQVETLSHAFLLAPLPDGEEGWREPRAKLSRMIKFAKAAGARSIYMVTGGRGGRSWEEGAEIFAAAVAPCVAEAEAAGIPLLVETTPFAYAGHHLVHNLRDTVRLAQIARIGVCIDIFSVWTEAGLKETIEQAAPLCHLVQASDYVCGDKCLPARAVPGDGDIPLKRICGWILGAGYKNGFDLELLGPRIEKEGRIEATARAAQYMSDLLEELGA